MAGTEDVSFLAGKLRIIKSVSSVSVRFPSSCISGMDVIVLGGHRKSATIDQVLVHTSTTRTWVRRGHSYSVAIYRAHTKSNFRTTSEF
jgi:hypothetical protein